MGEPDESSITSDFTGVQRVRPELRLSSEVETKKESACDAFAGKLITDFVAEKIASQSTEPQIPLEVRLGLCKIKDGRIEVFKPSSFDESRKRAIAYVAKGGPEWQKKDGSPDRPKKAMEILQKHWHRLQVLYKNGDVPTDAIEAYAAFMTGGVEVAAGWYGRYSQDHTLSGTVDHATHVRHREKLRAKTSEMIRSGEYKTLTDGDWRYFNHSSEAVTGTRDRIYISAKAYGDSSAVVGYWDAALKQVGIGHELMYKVSNYPSRLDTIVVYPSPGIDPGKLRLAIELFHSTCPPELLNETGVNTGNMIAGGISYGPEYFEHGSMNRLMFGEKISFGTEVTSLLDLALKLAFARLYTSKVESG